MSENILVTGLACGSSTLTSWIIVSMTYSLRGTGGSLLAPQEAFRSGTIVASQSMNFNGPNGSVTGFHPSLSGIVDSLQLVSMGPYDQGVNVFGIDNVAITPAPEPSPPLLFALCGLILASRRAQVVPISLLNAAYSRYFCSSPLSPRPTRR